MAGHWKGFLALITAFFVLSGSAVAATGSGTLDVTGPLALAGGVATTPAEGSLLIEGAGATVAIAVAEARITRVTWTEYAAEDVPVYAAVWDPVTVERFDAARATLRVDQPGDGARLLLTSEAYHADASRVAFSAASLDGITEQFTVLKVNAPGTRGGNGDIPPEADFQHVVRDAFRMTGDAALDLDARADSAVLYLYDQTLVVTTADGDTAYTSGSSTSSDAGGVETRRHTTFLLVELAGVEARIDAAAVGAQWFERAPNVEAGAFDAAAAAGTVRAGLRDHPVDDEAVVIAGDLVLAPERTTPGTGGGDFAAIVDPGYRVHVGGDITSISVAAAPTFLATHPVATAGGLGLVAALLVLWPNVKYWLTVAYLPLYTRLKEPELLENEVRNQIYTVIRENPGISARAVHRATEQSWGTVVYHLRQLERHHFVTSRRVGRSRNFYENHGKYRGMEVGLATLGAPRALQVAQVVLGEPGLTQERLTEITALPQPTVSYYVRKLKEAELICEARQGRYARYTPSDNLAELVGIAGSKDAGTATQPAVANA